MNEQTNQSNAATPFVVSVHFIPRGPTEDMLDVFGAALPLAARFAFASTYVGRALQAIDGGLMGDSRSGSSAMVVLPSGC